jgi:hypothetical protein
MASLGTFFYLKENMRIDCDDVRPKRMVLMAITDDEVAFPLQVSKYICSIVS